MTADSEPDDPMGLLMESFTERYRRGERPSLTEYTRQYPEIADRIKRLFPTLVLMEELSPEPEGAVKQTNDLVRPPRQLGEYEIGDELGRGGMGVVFRARQLSLNRDVALKVLTRPQEMGSQALQRFQLEARAAGQLHHPHIVPIIDVGDSEGVHYYAMQLIQGHGLDLILNELRCRYTLQATVGQSTDRVMNSLQRTKSGSSVQAFASAFLSGQFRPDLEGQVSVRAEDQESSDGATLSVPAGYFRRVAEIGIQLAEALEFAHKAGILHRDVKPSNVLVDESGHVWVTDFGLAKAVEDATDAASELTRTGDVIGTIQYMAPERFRGWSDPRSDVYGLGMTLYELLTFHPAFSDSDRLRLMEKVRTVPPAVPRSLNSRIPRDLETIVLKSIEKDASARYLSAAEMADDLRRYLQDRPILARRSSVRERVWQWCRRNPQVSVLSGLLAGLIVVAWLGMLYLWREAVASDEDARTHLAAERRNLNLAVAAVQEFSTKVSGDQRLMEHDLRPLRQSLLQTAASFHETLAQLREGSEDAHLDLARSYSGLARLTAEIESPQRAIELFQRAIAEFDEVLRLTPADRKIQSELSETLADAAFLMQKQGQSSQAEPVLDRSIGILKSQLGTNPGDPEIRSKVAALLGQKSLVLRALKRDDESRAVTEESLASWDELRTQYPDDSTMALGAARAHYTAGDVLLVRGLKWWREAEAELEKAWSILQPLLSGPESSFVDPGLTVALLARRSETAKVSRRLDVARTRIEEAIRTGRELVLRNPSVLTLQDGLAYSLYQSGNIEELSGNTEVASKMFLEASEMWERLVRLAPGNVVWEERLARSLANTAELRAQNAGTDVERGYLDRAVTLLEGIFAREPGRPNIKLLLADALSKRGEMLIRTRQFEQAERDLARAAGMEDPQLRDLYSINHAWALVQLGKYREAVEEAQAASAALFENGRAAFARKEITTAARTCAVAISLAQKDAMLSLEERETVVKEYTEAALNVIRSLLKSDPKAAETLRDCEEFEPLRKMQEFVVLFPE